MTILFAAMKALGVLRVSDDHINQGIDVLEHGEAAYVFHGLKNTATVTKTTSKSSLQMVGDSPF